MKQFLAQLVRDEQGQDMIEYSLLAAFISIVAWQTVQAIGGDVATIYGGVNTATTDAAGAAGGAGS